MKQKKLTLKQKLIKLKVYKQFVKNYYIYQYQIKGRGDEIIIQQELRYLMSSKNKNLQYRFMNYKIDSFEWRLTDEGQSFWQDICWKITREDEER
jgi:hypothetical protein